MPIYEYRCLSCAQLTENIQRFTDPDLAACPECGGEVKRLVSAPAIQFKGSGWYVTDYAGKKTGSSDSDSGTNTAASSSGDSSKSGDGDSSKSSNGDSKSGGSDSKSGDGSSASSKKSSSDEKKSSSSSSKQDS